MIDTDSSSIWGFVGGAFAVVGTIIVSIINGRSNYRQKEAKKIQELSDKVANLETDFNSLKDSFTLVCDEMERNDTMTPQLKQFRKLYGL
tara:strand:- start:1159 stop:1428 length:270 start_codon:yes stop_codon:yes gene_type:complete